MKETIGPSNEHDGKPTKPGYSCWIEHGVYYQAPTVDPTKFGGHTYANGGYENGVRECPCGCYMGSANSSGPVDPFGACPKNPRTEEPKTNYTWDPEDPRCVCCGEFMQLNDGCEWDEDPAMNLCHQCALSALADARKLSLAPSSTSEVVLAFARKMDQALQANMHKGGRAEWKKQTLTDLESQTQEAMYQVSDSVFDAEGCKQDVAKNAVDLANYALMLADACGGMEEGK